MALTVHMKIEGKTQGLISEKCSTREGREDTIHVLKAAHSITIPKDSQDGRVRGYRTHSPLSVLKEIDRASPMLSQALVRNELLTVTLYFYRFSPDGSGVEEQFYTMVLEDANITTYKGELPFTLDEESSRLPPLEHLEIAFKKITTTYEPDGVGFSDSWDKPIT